MLRLRGGREKGEDNQWHETNNAKRQNAAVTAVNVVEGRLLVFIVIVFIISRVTEVCTDHRFYPMPAKYQPFLARCGPNVILS